MELEKQQQEIFALQPGLEEKQAQLANYADLLQKTEALTSQFSKLKAQENLQGHTVDPCFTEAEWSELKHQHENLLSQLQVGTSLSFLSCYLQFSLFSCGVIQMGRLWVKLGVEEVPLKKGREYFPLSLWGINTETNETQVNVKNILYLYKHIWIAIIWSICSYILQATVTFLPLGRMNLENIWKILFQHLACSWFHPRWCKLHLYPVWHSVSNVSSILRESILFTSTFLWNANPSVSCYSLKFCSWWSPWYAGKRAR